jgi:hypothetical protein
LSAPADGRGRRAFVVKKGDIARAAALDNRHIFEFEIGGVVPARKFGRSGGVPCALGRLR